MIAINSIFISPFFCLPTKNWRNSCVPRIDRNGEEASVCLSSFFNYQIEKNPMTKYPWLPKTRTKFNSTSILQHLMLWYWRKNNFQLWQALKLPFSWIQLSETSVVNEVSLKGWWNRSVLVFSSFHCAQGNKQCFSSGLFSWFKILLFEFVRPTCLVNCLEKLVLWSRKKY